LKLKKKLKKVTGTVTINNGSKINEFKGCNYNGTANKLVIINGTDCIELFRNSTNTSSTNI